MRVSAIPFLLGLAALAAASPAKGQAPASATPISAYDGTYVGVSAENISSGNTLAGGRAHTQGYAGARACRSFPAPARLTISGGRARAKWGDRMLEGYAASDGSLSMSTGYGQKFEGRIEAQQIKGRLVGYCAYNLTWQKQG